MYLVHEDLPTLIELVGEDIAFIVADGERRWRATLDRSRPLRLRTALWHVPSGPLPLLRSSPDLPVGKVADPWAGWTEERTGADATTPYFGTGHPGVFWLNLRIPGSRPGSVCGLSSFEWIGNRYSIIGSPAPLVTAKRWEKLRRQIKKNAHKVPRGGRSEATPAEIWAFPGAYALLGEAGRADANPL
jgi:hypothetical protein